MHAIGAAVGCPYALVLFFERNLAAVGLPGSSQLCIYSDPLHVSQFLQWKHQSSFCPMKVCAVFW
jgi:hypothetical protein